MATPALRTLRKSFPKAKITLLLKPSLKDIIKGLPYYDEIIEYEPKGRHRGLLSHLSFIYNLRKKRFDLGITLANSFSSAALLFLSRIPTRVGYNRNLRGWMFTHKKEPKREGGKIVPVNKVDYYLGLCEFLGCRIDSKKTKLITSVEAEQKIESLFRKNKIKQNDFIVTLIPGASFGPSKCWKREYFAEVADTLIDRYNAKIFIIAGPSEEEIVEDIKRMMKRKPMEFEKPVIPLSELMVIIKRSSIVITNDTGPRHFAQAFDIPCIVLMGPTDPRHTDTNLEKTIILREEVECSPCHLRVCPRDHRCMTLITPSKVLSKVELILRESRYEKRVQGI